MIREPMPYKSGLCRVCGKPRRLRQTALYRSHAQRDAFCSRVCCESYFTALSEGRDADIGAGVALLGQRRDPRARH